jgi:hypothetical protein
MFSEPVEHVARTSIFARQTDAERQVLAYSMEVQMRTELAMVLPLPVPPGVGEDALRFIDLSGYRDFFYDLRAGFPTEILYLRSGGPVPGAAQPKSILVVHDVGDFDASFVPSLADFSRLDPRFQMPPGVWDSLPGYADYGFAVFKLKPPHRSWNPFRRPKQTRTIQPMAFEFPRREASRLFFPTVHVHDGAVSAQALFDHALYLQRSLDSEAPLDASWVESEGLATTFVSVERTQGLVRGEQLCFRRVLEGLLPNADTWV